jgi:Zn-dependent peptidase ImmA (M78 family)
MKHFKLRPEVVRILGRNYVVVFEADSALGTNNLGTCDTQKCVIAIRENQHPVEEADTLIHEIMHAVWYCMSIAEGGADEEAVVRRMASGFAAVLMDNPILLDYLKSIQTPNYVLK